jgi:hypothetical protein
MIFQGARWEEPSASVATSPLRSRNYLVGSAPPPQFYPNVSWCNGYALPGHASAGIAELAQRPGLSTDPEVPHDHHDHYRRPHLRPAAVH